MAISLESLISELNGIKFNPDNWYRAHGDSGLTDFNQTKSVRANPKGMYDSTYYSKGGVESRYMRKGGGSIIEALPNRGIEAVPDTRRYGITSPDKLQTIQDRIRVYERQPTGMYKSTYDNITPWKFSARLLANNLGPLIPLALGEALVTGMFKPQEERGLGSLFTDTGKAMLGTREPSIAEQLTWEDVN